MWSSSFLVWTTVPGSVFGIVAMGLATVNARHLAQSVSPARAKTCWLASRMEESAFRHLQTQYPPDDFIISAHMLLIDVIGRNQSGYLSDADREFSWKAHCDFVVVSASDLTIERVVEVNGSYHQMPKQWERDRQKRRILAQFGIRLQVQPAKEW